MIPRDCAIIICRLITAESLWIRAECLNFSSWVLILYS